VIKAEFIFILLCHIWWFDAQETFFIINVENSLYFCENRYAQLVKKYLLNFFFFNLQI